MTKWVIKYQDTDVDVERTVAELAALIKRYGGSRFEQQWRKDGGVGGVRLAVRRESLSELPVSLAAKTAEIERTMRDAGLWKSYTPEARAQKLETQAHRIAWRHLKDLSEQLLLAVSLGLKTLPEAFLADVEVYDRQRGELVRMAEFLERRASSGPEGLELLAAEENRRAIPLPSGR